MVVSVGLFIIMILIASIAGSIIGSVAVLAIALYTFNNSKGSRRRR